MSLDLRHGNSEDVLTTLPAQSVQCCITSPPYYGLRDYGHAAQIGLEDTPDAYIARLVAVFREVRRVLAEDGVLWVNCGDTYAAQRGGSPMPAETLAGGVSGQGDTVAKRGRESAYLPHRSAASLGLKHKDLIGIPWMLAFALRADGWYLRQDIIWHKPNPMPESVTDRCTKAHEYVFLLSKSSQYYYDAAAIAERSAGLGETDIRFGGSKYGDSQDAHYQTKSGNIYTDTGTRNRRSVWTVATQPFADAHFATFPPKLIQPMILAGSRMSDTILDPFCGSGTTGMVALKEGRDFIGIDLNAEYLEMARTRCTVTGNLFAEESV